MEIIGIYAILLTAVEYLKSFSAKQNALEYSHTYTYMCIYTYTHLSTCMYFIPIRKYPYIFLWMLQRHLKRRSIFYCQRMVVNMELKYLPCWLRYLEHLWHNLFCSNLLSYIDSGLLKPPFTNVLLPVSSASTVIFKYVVTITYWIDS